MKSLLITFVAVVVLSATLSAQVTTIKLPTADSTSSFVVTDNANKLLSKIYANGEFYMLGTYNSGATLPVLGAGPRMTWNPYSAAFRAGYVTAAQWDAANVGSYSFAAGINTTASGAGSAAFGTTSTASGAASTAMGDHTTASGQYSTAMGQNSTASGQYSIAMGKSAIANGNYCTAIGNDVSTSVFTGSCIIGDSSATGTTSSTFSNQMMMRFAGGYLLWTNAAASIGVELATGGSSWLTVSDSTRKEHFAKVDGEYFLHSIAHLRIGSWNYKGQDVQHFRHYGPMAQEIFHYFGKDQLGTIGNDTTLASADMDGIMMICLQALEKRTGELQKATASISELQRTVSAQQVEIASRDKDIEELKSDFIQLKKEIAAMNELKPSSAHASLTSADLTK